MYCQINFLIAWNMKERIRFVEIGNGSISHSQWAYSCFCHFINFTDFSFMWCSCLLDVWKMIIVFACFALRKGGKKTSLISQLTDEHFGIVFFSIYYYHWVLSTKNMSQIACKLSDGIIRALYVFFTWWPFSNVTLHIWLLCGWATSVQWRIHIVDHVMYA